MAAAAEHSSSSSSERNLEQNPSLLLTREVLCEVFRSLHTLTGQVSGGAAGRGGGGAEGEHLGPVPLVLSEAGVAEPARTVCAAGVPRTGSRDAEKPGPSCLGPRDASGALDG